MAEGIKISEMDEMTALTENCYVPIIDEGANRKINLVNAIYSTGSIYLTVNDVDPSTLFGGTWEKIENRFLVGAGNEFGAGTIGGSKSASIRRTIIANVYEGTAYITPILGADQQDISTLPPYLSVYIYKRIA